MALTEEQIIDKIEVVDTGDWSIVQVRTATVIRRDGAAEVSRFYHRHAVSPADDWSSESDKVKAICDVVHNDTTKAAYEAAQAEGAS
tara:strand:+ start:1866 stop:2126 length:261 start_codon:yes stop_codon:yes gene_type:complete